jgi:hypothetical protein
MKSAPFSIPAPDAPSRCYSQSFRNAAEAWLKVMERRLRTRFPLTLELDYHLLGRGSVAGRGKTINISSSGAWVTAEHIVPPGTRVEMNIAWPISQDGIPLELTVWGRVLRNEQGKFAVLFVFANIVPHHRPRAEQDSSGLGVGLKGPTHRIV